MLDFPEHRLKLLQFQKIYRKTKKCLFTSIIIVGQKNIQYLHLFYLLPIIGFHPRIPGLLQISLLSAVCYKEIKIVNMIVFFARVFTALETVLGAVVLYAAPCNFTRLISFTAATAGTVFIQEHGAKPTIQPTKGK